MFVVDALSRVTWDVSSQGIESWISKLNWNFGFFKFIVIVLDIVEGYTLDWLYPGDLWTSNRVHMKAGGGDGGQEQPITSSRLQATVSRRRSRRLPPVTH